MNVLSEKRFHGFFIGLKLLNKRNQEEIENKICYISFEVFLASEGRSYELMNSLKIK